MVTWAARAPPRDRRAPTDDDLAAEHDTAETVVDLTRETWRALLIAQCEIEVLAAAPRGAQAVVHAIRSWGVPVWLDTRGRAGPGVLRLTHTRTQGVDA